MQAEVKYNTSPPSDVDEKQLKDLGLSILKPD
jgi:hypothetical protein